MKVGTIIIIILVIGAAVIIWQSDASLTTKEGRSEFVGRYFGWLKIVGKNTVDVTAHAVRDYDWLPKDEGAMNATNLTVVEVE